MKAKKSSNLAVLITLIVLIVAANTFTVLFALKRVDMESRQDNNVLIAEQTTAASEPDPLSAKPQSITLRRGTETIRLGKGSEDYNAVLSLNEKRKNITRYCTELGEFETIANDNDIQLIYEFEKETSYVLPLKYERQQTSLQQVYFVLTGKNHECFATKSESGYICYTGLGSNTDLIRICKDFLNSTTTATS